MFVARTQTALTAALVAAALVAAALAAVAWALLAFVDTLPTIRRTQRERDAELGAWAAAAKAQAKITAV